MFIVLYGDDPNKIVYEFSKHRTRQAAEKAIVKAKKDRYWATHFFVIKPPPQQIGAQKET